MGYHDGALVNNGTITDNITETSSVGGDCLP